MRKYAIAAVMTLMFCPPVVGHPHFEREILLFTGSITKVDTIARTIELDTIDPRTKRPTNVLLFLDKKVKIRNGKGRLAVADLKAGDRVTCTAKLTEDDSGSERWISSNMQLIQP
jgi:hypothetical protein